MLLDQEELSGFQVYVHLDFLQILGWCAQKCAPALPFAPTPQCGFCAEACWLNRGHSTHRCLPQVHEHTLPGKTTLEKNGLSLSPKTRRTNSLITFENAGSTLHTDFVLLHFTYCFSSSSWCLFFLLLLCICTLILQPGHFLLISQLLSAIGLMRYHREFKIFSIKILHGCCC